MIDIIDKEKIEQTVELIGFLSQLSDQTPFSSVGYALVEYEKSKWIPVSEMDEKEHLWHTDVQIRVDLEGDIYTTVGNYTGQYWHLANVSDYVDGIVTHYQSMAATDIKE